MRHQVSPQATAAAALTTHHVIFGYGSLICAKSRAITAPTTMLPGRPSAQPAVVHHLERTWTARGGGRNGFDRNSTGHFLEGKTFMGVRRRHGARCAGVLLSVTERELAQFDIREKNYDRVEVDIDHLGAVPGLPPPDLAGLVVSVSVGSSEDVKDGVVDNGHGGAVVLSTSTDDPNATDDARATCGENNEDEDALPQPDKSVRECGGHCSKRDVCVWVYVQKSPLPPNSRYPISQSYVDIMLRGCLSISTDFARSFLATTHGWYCDPNPKSLRVDGEFHINGSSVEEDDSKGDGDDAEEDPHYTWVDDRDHPLYVRADAEYSREKGWHLDEMLREHHPDAFEKRRTLETLLPASENRDAEEFD